MEELGRVSESRGHETCFEVDGSPGFWITVADIPWRLLISEELDKAELPVREEVEEASYDWKRIPLRIEPVPSGRLAIELSDDHRFSGRKRRWADRRRWSLVSKIPEIISELEARSATLHAREVEEHHLLELRRREWQQAMDEARSQFHLDQKRRALLDQVAMWRQHQDVVAFCDVLDKLVSEDVNQDRAGRLRSWLEWCRGYAARVGTNVPMAPEEKEPTPNELKPYLGKWSPYGPEN